MLDLMWFVSLSFVLSPLSSIQIPIKIPHFYILDHISASVLIYPTCYTFLESSDHAWSEDITFVLIFLFLGSLLSTLFAHILDVGSIFSSWQSSWDFFYIPFFIIFSLLFIHIIVFLVSPIFLILIFHCIYIYIYFSESSGHPLSTKFASWGFFTILDLNMSFKFRSEASFKK